MIKDAEEAQRMFFKAIRQVKDNLRLLPLYEICKDEADYEPTEKFIIDDIEIRIGIRLCEQCLESVRTIMEDELEERYENERSANEKIDDRH